MKNKKLKKVSGGDGASISNAEYKSENLELLDPNNSNNTTKNNIGIGKNVNAKLVAVDNSISEAKTTTNLEENYDKHKTTTKFLHIG